MTEKAQHLLVGIDLGTSRSAIAVSNGVRDMVASVVGWPKGIRPSELPLSCCRIRTGCFRPCCSGIW